MRIFKSKKAVFNLIRCFSRSYAETTEEITSLVRDHLHGQWQNATADNLHIQKLKGGMSNAVYQVTLPEIYQKENEPKSVIVRLYGSLNKELVFQQICETLALACLSERNYGPKLFAVFPGGRIEEFIDARALERHEMGEIKFSRSIAEKMAEIHSMNIPITNRKGLMYEMMNDWLMKFNKECGNWKVKNDREQNCVEKFRKIDLSKEIDWLRNFLHKFNSPTVFCHNDLQQGNILVNLDTVNEMKPKITFIDYEYCFYNSRAFELANHFLEYPMKYSDDKFPYFSVDESYFPTEDHQLVFIHCYLNAINDIRERNMADKDSINKFDSIDVSEEEGKLLKEVSHYKLASHLFWAIWAAVRSQSTVNFEYWEYCNMRLDAYYKTKDKIIWET